MSRLTLAWSSAAIAAVTLVGAAFYPELSGRGVSRISLPVEGIENFARPQTARLEPASPTTSETGGLRLAAPGLREEPLNADLDTEDDADMIRDLLAYPQEFDPAAGEEELPFTAEDIVITIAGSERRVTPVTAASLTPSRRATPVPEPDSALLRNTPWGQIPKPAKDGRKALHHYRNAFAGGDGRPQVALVVGGLGLNRALTERAIDELPPEVSLAFAPYAKDLDFWTRKARGAGHEVLIELPMENYGGDPAALGAAGLLTSRSQSENLQRLDWLMSRFGGYFAATNYLGGKFAADEEAMKPVLKKLREAGVGYIDDTGAAAAISRQTGAAVSSVTRIIPPAPDNSARRSVKGALQALEKRAEEDGVALGKTYAYAATIEEIAAWSAGLDEKGLVLAPASSTLPSPRASK